VARELALELAAQGRTTGGGGRLGALKGAFEHLLSADQWQERLVEDNPIGRKVLFDQARKRLLARTHGNYPAPEKALEAMRIGAADGPEAGLAAESRFFGELAVS